MVDYAIKAAQIVLVFVVVYWVAAQAMAALYRVCRVRCVVVTQRPWPANVVTVFGLAAPLVATWSLVFLYSPGLNHIFIADHCHGQQCLPHSPVTVQSVLLSSVASLALLVLLILSLGLYCQIKSRIRQVQSLERLASYKPSRHFYLIDTPALVACCSGVLRCRVFVSTALQRRLSSEQLGVVLSHEFAHARRRDNLRKLLLACAVYAWPGAIKRQVLQDFEWMCEQACDQHAIRQWGQPLVTQTRRRVALLQGGSPRAVQEMESDTLGDVIQKARRRVTALALCVALALVVFLQIGLFSGGAHYLLEML